jgi:excisionase family DNA binding protein
MATSCITSRCDLFTPEQAANYLGLKPQTLANWRMTGRYQLPFLRCGRLIKYRSADLDQWLESRRVGAID